MNLGKKQSTPNNTQSILRSIICILMFSIMAKKYKKGNYTNILKEMIFLWSNNEKSFKITFISMYTNKFGAKSIWTTKIKNIIFQVSKRAKTQPNLLIYYFFIFKVLCLTTCGKLQWYVSHHFMAMNLMLILFHHHHIFWHVFLF